MRGGGHDVGDMERGRYDPSRDQPADVRHVREQRGCRAGPGGISVQLLQMGYSTPTEGSGLSGYGKGGVLRREKREEKRRSHEKREERRTRREDTKRDKETKRRGDEEGGPLLAVTTSETWNISLKTTGWKGGLAGAFLRGWSPLAESAISRIRS